MALYVGETVRVTSTAIDFDRSTALDDDDVNQVLLDVFDTDDELLLEDVAMAWSDEHDHWFYDWTTTGQAAGTYRIKVTVESAGITSWEFGRIRLKANPVED